MRRVLLSACLLSSGCITGALHEAAFPEGYNYDFALEANAAAVSGQGFRVCFHSRSGPVEIELRPTVSDLPATFALPLARVDSQTGQIVWKASSTRGCTMQGISGLELPVGSLVFSDRVVNLPGKERRSALSAAISAHTPLSVEISSDRKRLRVVTQTGEITLRPATYGEFDPGFAAYYEDQWVVETRTAPTSWEPLKMLDQKALNVYYRNSDGSMRLKSFPLTSLPQNMVVFVPFLSEEPKENRYYLLPLYPFAALLDAMTVVLQLTIWYEDARSTAACFRW
jgi:hypothetical protein